MLLMPFYLADTSFSCHLPQPSFPFNLISIFSLLQLKLRTPAFESTSRNSCECCLIPTSFACHPYCIFLNWCLLKWSLNRLCWNNIEHLLKFQIPGLIPYLLNQNLLDGDWLVHIFNKCFRASSTH